MAATSEHPVVVIVILVVEVGFEERNEVDCDAEMVICDCVSRGNRTLGPSRGLRLFFGRELPKTCSGHANMRM
jgi:hypothetical protein